MFKHAALFTCMSILMVASCVTSSSESSDPQAQTGSDGDDGAGDTGGEGTGCIEGSCGNGSGSGSGSGATTPVCEQPATVGDGDTVKLKDHDPSSRGQRCLDCHGGGSHPEFTTQPPQFDFGGRVVNPATGAGRSHALVRVPTADGFIAVETNQLGYFWFPPQAYYGQDQATTGTVTFPVSVGVETSGTLTVMCAKAVNGNCSSCHDGVTTAAIY